MAKIMKFADKVKKLKRTGVVNFQTDEGEWIEFAIESRSDKAVDEVNRKYELSKPSVPTKKLPTKQGGFKIIEDPENKDYRMALNMNTKRNFAELALLFLADDEKPEGTLEEQVDQIMEVELAGFIGKIVEQGLRLSAMLEDQEEMNEAKND